MSRTPKKEWALPRRCSLNIVVEKEECCDWSDLYGVILSAVTCSGLDAVSAEVVEIASSLNEAGEPERRVADEERLRIHREIQLLQRRLAALGDGCQ